MGIAMKRYGVWGAITFGIGVVLCIPQHAAAAKPPAPPTGACEAAKLRAAGKAIAERAKCWVKAVGSLSEEDARCATKVSAALAKAFAKVEKRGSCTTRADADALRVRLDGFVGTLMGHVTHGGVGIACARPLARSLARAATAAFGAHAADRSAPRGKRAATAHLKGRQQLPVHDEGVRGACPGGLSATVTEQFDAFVADVVAALAGCATVAADTVAAALPATGRQLLEHAGTLGFLPDGHGVVCRARDASGPRRALRYASLRLARASTERLWFVAAPSADVYRLVRRGSDEVLTMFNLSGGVQIHPDGTMRPTSGSGAVVAETVDIAESRASGTQDCIVSENTCRIVPDRLECADRYCKTHRRDTLCANAVAVCTLGPTPGLNISPDPFSNLIEGIKDVIQLGLCLNRVGDIADKAKCTSVAGCPCVVTDTCEGGTAVGTCSANGECVGYSDPEPDGAPCKLIKPNGSSFPTCVKDDPIEIAVNAHCYGGQCWQDTSNEICHCGCKKEGFEAGCLECTFEIDHIEPPPVVRPGESKNARVYYTGTPTFPVRGEGRVVDCTHDCWANPFEITEPQNPILVAYSCRPETTVRVVGTFELELVDKNGLRTKPARFVGICDPAARASGHAEAELAAAALAPLSAGAPSGAGAKRRSNESGRRYGPLPPAEHDEHGETAE